MRTQYQSALGAMRLDARREATARVAIERAAAQQVGQTQRTAIRAQVQMAAQASRERVRLATAEARERQRAESASVRAVERASREAVRVSDRANRERQRGFQAMLRDRIREERTASREAERVERNHTRFMEAEGRRRLQIDRQIAQERLRQTRDMQRNLARSEREGRATDSRRGRAAADVVGGVGRAMMSGVGSLHTQAVDARHQRALADRRLGDTARGAGMSAQELASLRQELLGTPGQPNSGFLQQTGMSLETVVNALKFGQERGSSLETRPDRTRAQAIQEALSTIRMANAESTDPGELLAARGRLSQAGLSGDALDEAVRFTIGAAQRGSVETGAIIQQGLPGATQLMQQRAQALGPNATPEARARARLQAYQESVALQEVAAAAGRNPGNTANTLSGLNNFLSQPRRQEMILANIRAAERQVNTSTPEGMLRRDRLRQLQTDMFERDPTRTGNAMRMREGFSPLDFAARLTQATGGNASAAMNILAGTGQGNAQSLLSPQRALLTFLGTEGDRVREMMNGGGITTDAISAHQGAVENDALAQYNRTQEANANALVENTGAVGRLSQAFEAWVGRNPVASTLGGGVLAALGGAAARYLPAAATGVLAAGSSAVGSLGLSGAAAAIGSFALPVAGGVAALGAGLGAGYGINRARGHSGPEANPFSGRFYSEAVDGLSYMVSGDSPASGVLRPRNAPGGAGGGDGTAAITQAIERGFRSVNVTATVDPHTVQQVLSSQPTPNGGRGGPR